jgi:hypothetical protein
MPNDTRDDRANAKQGYEPPRFEVICLACEVTSYEIDDDQPLF